MQSSPRRLVWSRSFGALAAAALLAGTLFAAVPATGAPAASQPCVNPGGTGGCSSSINAAIAAASPGATITIQHGTYVENVVVNKAVTLSGNGNPVIEPATSDPNCGGAGGTSNCAGASIVVLVQSDNVTIAGLTVNGDNPALHSGVVIGGADIDARDGIYSDPPGTTYQNLAIRDVTVENIYLRGIQLRSLSFLVRGDTVRNVQGDVNSSVAVLVHNSSGTMRDNTISDTPDGLNSNWSHGIQFLDNVITRSGSGVHSDNAGGDGTTTSDVIQGNTVKDCTPGGYGVWSFVSYVAPVFEDNTITNCDIGLAAYGTQQPNTPAFYDNTVRGSGGANTVGALISTDLTSFGFPPDLPIAVFLGNNSIKNVGTGIHLLQTAGGGHPLTATLDGNTISGSGTGIDVDGGALTLLDSCVQRNTTGVLVRNGGTATAFTNAIQRNSSFGLNNTTGTAVDAQLNWWGAASGPAPAGSGDRISANVNATPFLTRQPAGQPCSGDGD
ncbi:MAG TPA: NosD domain-containing protein [Dehalococcoidia bacterium]|nr:NosD domain-containing protein [Dehalococcoidia bacterium]